MFLFLLNTPTQLLNAIVLIYERFRDEQCDAYYTENLSQFFEKEEIRVFFKNAYLIELLPDICKRDGNIKKSIVRIKNAMDFRKIVKVGLPSSPALYSRVFASGISLRNYEIYYAIKVQNRSVSLSLYEEGMCEYYNLGKKSIPQIIFSYLFFKHYYMREADSLFVYEPKAVVCRWKNIEVKPIPKKVDTELLQCINSIFGYQKTGISAQTNKVIILEQAFYDKEDIERQEEIINKLGRAFGKENIVIKLHPRSEKGKYDDSFTCCKTTIPLEIIIMNGELPMSNLFVSISSSSVLNFKLMFNMEPSIIVLNRLNRKTRLLSDEVFDYVRDHTTYRNFWVPESMQQFDNTIAQIKERSRNKETLQ